MKQAATNHEYLLDFTSETAESLPNISMMGPITPIVDNMHLAELKKATMQPWAGRTEISELALIRVDAN